MHARVHVSSIHHNQAELKECQHHNQDPNRKKTNTQNPRGSEKKTETCEQNPYRPQSDSHRGGVCVVGSWASAHLIIVYRDRPCYLFHRLCSPLSFLSMLLQEAQYNVCFLFAVLFGKTSDILPWYISMIARDPGMPWRRASLRFRNRKEGREVSHRA